MSEGPSTCPDWWPTLLWNLHHIHWPGPGPINFPPDIDNIMAGLSIHTFSYLLNDQVAGEEIRKIAQAQLSSAVQNLSKKHAKSPGKNPH